MGFRVLERTIGQHRAPIKFTFAMPRGAVKPVLHLSIVGWLFRQICGEKGRGDSQFDCSTCKFTILIGTDEDFDKVRVSFDPTEGEFSVRHAPMGDTYLLKLGVVKEMPDDALAKKEPVAEYAILEDDKDTIEIRFPAWVWQKVETQKVLPPPVRRIDPPEETDPTSRKPTTRVQEIRDLAKRLGKGR